MILEHERVERIRRQRALHVDLSANAQKAQMDLVVERIATIIELTGGFVMEASVPVVPQARRLGLRTSAESFWVSAPLRLVLDLDAGVVDPEVLAAEHEAVDSEADLGRET